MRKIDSVIIHCTDTPDTPGGRVLNIGAKWIDAVHRAAPRFWKKIGYHYVIRRSGEVEIGRDENEIGAHASGHNERSIGVVWVGRDNITDAQHEKLIKLVRALMEKHGVGVHRVWGHSEVNAYVTCPRLPMDKIRQEIAG